MLTGRGEGRKLICTHTNARPRERPGAPTGEDALRPPRDAPDALAILASEPRTVLAGGTDLYPATAAPELAGPVLDITGIAELAGISRRAGHLRIGACTPWSAIRDAALPPACDALRAAAAEVGGVQIQNAGTIGGNLCNASPAADGVPPLLALDAEVELAGPPAAAACRSPPSSTACAAPPAAPTKS